MASNIVINNTNGSLLFQNGQLNLPINPDIGSYVVADSSSTYTTANYYNAFKNRIINGNMEIIQRGTTAVTANNSFPVDRFFISKTNTGTLSAQSVADTDVGEDSPPGFNRSLKFTVTSKAASTSTQYVGFKHIIEGFNLLDFCLGLSSAKTFTLSFWVKSNAIGTYAVSLANDDDSLYQLRTYSIAVANTWEKKSITFSGPTTGTWLRNNSAGLDIFWDFGSGSDFLGLTTSDTWQSTSPRKLTVVGTSDPLITDAVNLINHPSIATPNFYITGVQLELGPYDTDFHFLDYETNLSLCRRYFYKINKLNAGQRPVIGTGLVHTTGSAHISLPLPTPMRSAPQISYDILSLGLYTAATTFTPVNVTSLGTHLFNSDNSLVTFIVNATIGAHLRRFTNIRVNFNTAAASYIQFESELS